MKLGNRFVKVSLVRDLKNSRGVGLLMGSSEAATVTGFLRMILES